MASQSCTTPFWIGRIISAAAAAGAAGWASVLGGVACCPCCAASAGCSSRRTAAGVTYTRGQCRCNQVDQSRCTDRGPIHSFPPGPRAHRQSLALALAVKPPARPPQPHHAWLVLAGKAKDCGQSGGFISDSGRQAVYQWSGQLNRRGLVGRRGTQRAPEAQQQEGAGPARTVARLDGAAAQVHHYSAVQGHEVVGRPNLECDAGR